MNEFVVAALVVFVQGFLHYFPWVKVLRRKLPRLAAYTLGVAGLMVPFSVWLFGRDPWAVVVLWITICAGGLSVGLWWLVDWVVDQWHGHRNASERERAAMDGIKELASGTGK
jgi:hypothetical protein